MPIQVMQIFRESLQNVRTHSMDWVRVAFAPLMVLLFGFLFMTLMYWSSGQPIPMGSMADQQAGVQELTFPIILGNIVHFMTYIIGTFTLYINGFRYGILQEGGDQWWNLSLDKRFLKMILYSLLIVVLAVLYVLASFGIGFGIQTLGDMTALTVIFAILMVTFGFYALLRVGLAFALISVDQSQPIQKSWRLLKGNVLRLFGLMLLIGLVVSLIALAGFIIIGVFAGLFLFISPWLAGLLIIPGGLFFVFIWLFSWAFQAKAISLVLLSFTEGKAF